MNAIHSFTEKVIQILKHDSSYRLDPNLDGRVLLQVLNHRGVALLRGSWYRIWLRKNEGVLFVGPHVKLRHPQLISVGCGVIIEDYVYIDALSQRGVRLGNNVTIAKFSTIQCTGVIQNLGVGLTIGDDSAVGAYSFLGAQGGIKIGNNVIMGPRVGFHAENHKHQDTKIPIRLQGIIRRGIMIDDGCWIGASSTILDGVHMHVGCVVAAGSVVTKDVPPYSIIAGVPAKVIGKRNDIK